LKIENRGCVKQLYGADAEGRGKFRFDPGFRKRKDTWRTLSALFIAKPLSIPKMMLEIPRITYIMKIYAQE